MSRRSLAGAVALGLLLSASVAAAQNPIVVENGLTGNPPSEWDISGIGDPTIEGFATRLSVLPGETINFKIQSANPYRIKIYRLGWYAGLGARLWDDLGPFAAQTQPSPYTESTTGLIDCGNWAVSASWPVPASAVSGLYIARLERTDLAGASHIAFVVRDDARASDLLFKTSDGTWQAYNTWGGNSLYQGSASAPPVSRAHKVSYNRPFMTRATVVEDWLFNAEYPMVRWLERNGYDVTYTTDLDVAQDVAGPANRLRNHDAVLSVGHDEYWSASERAAFEDARAAGVHLAFFSGNEIYWKTRWEPSPVDGDPNRTMVCYKEGTAGEIACGSKCDPLSPNIWTGLWRSGCAPEYPGTDACLPENALSGNISWVGSTGSISVPSTYGDLRFWRNTSVATLPPGQTATLSAGSLGYEWDFEQFDAFYPPGRITLSSTTLGGQTHRMSLYRHASGALVFGAGTVQWSWGLDGTHDRGGSVEDPRMQQATINLFADMGVQPATMMGGMVAATASTDLTSPVSTIDSPLSGSTVAINIPITIAGIATDAGGVLAGVEVSTDGGATWRPANGRETWSLAWTPTALGSVTILSRGFDDSGNLETPGPGVTVIVGTTASGPPDTPVAAADYYTTSRNVTLNVPAPGVLANDTDPNVGDVLTAVLRSNPSHGSVTLNADGSFTYVPTTDYAGGDQFTYRAQDVAGHLSATATVTIGVDQVCPCTIFHPTAEPVTPRENDPNPVEIGVRFRSDVNGWITAVRFFKHVENSGSHTAHLWTAGGTLLATQTFVGESASGWQEVAFTSPVPVTAGDTYIASYHSYTGYAQDQYVFAGAGVDNPPLHALQDGVAGPNGVYAYGPSGTFPTQGYVSSNYYVDAVLVTSIGPDVTPPTVLSTSPTNGATGVTTGTNVTATFSEAIDPATLTSATFELRDPFSVPVAATLSFSAATRIATLDPTAPLAYSTTYTATITTGVTDPAGNPLAAGLTWSFTTGAEPPPPPDEGPGGPILVVATAANPFGRYFAEILRAEGLTGFLVTDVSLLSPALLNAHDVVILGETPLSGAQVTMLDNWVNAGGTLVASRPDKQLAGLLGLTDANATLANQYLAVNTASGPGAGIVGETIQFHGTADLYTLSGAEALATLYSNATTSTPNPAVTLRSVGSNGGRAMAFTYDLARSIVYTRQGNPAWAGDERDGVGPLRPDDMFYGAKAGDVQPDWIDLNKVAIPQADEQQRLLVNMILKGNLHRMPLPRFWHFPKGEKAVVIMTGDDHGAGGTFGRMNNELAASPPGCSVDDWECIRSSSYVEGSVATLNDANVAAFTAQGFEVGVHFDTGCANWTPTSLRSVFTNMQSWFAGRFPSAPPPSTNRNHCIAWSDWATQAEVQVENGIRLDVNYYFWPPGWVQNRPGMFTGSGMPMRFARLDGSLIDCYQAVTQMTDESGQNLAMTIDSLLTRALDVRGWYGAFTANMHTDNAAHGGWSALVAAAQARGVPVVSGRQMLTWLDGRNGSQFQSLSWNGTTNVLAFTLVVGTGARNLVAMLPTQGPVGALTGITRGGAPIAYTTEVIKGIEYAFFPAVAGPHEAQYLVDTTAPLISAVTATPLNDGTASITWTTTEPADSRVDYGTDPEALAVGVLNATLVTNHVISLTGLTPNTTYYYRVTSVDAASNSATSPEPPAAPASFTTPPPPCFEDLTAAQFALGSFGAGTYLTVTTDGEVTLAPAVGAEFNGVALDAGWQALLWTGGSATVSVSGGQLTLNGARVNPEPYTPVASGHTLEFVATFTGAEYQHVGFGAGSHAPPSEIYNTTPWAMFSTSTGGVFHARTHNGAGGISDFPLSTSLLNAPHRYRIDWLADRVDFFVDGSLVRSEPIAVGGAMRPAIGDYSAIGTPLFVDWIRMSPYSAAGTFTSRVFDGLGTTTWGLATYSADLPAGASVALSVRKGTTPVPDGTWTPWTGVANGGAVGGSSRYIQYQAELAATDVSVTPALRDVVISCGVTPDVTPPAISAVVATPGSSGTTATVAWTTDELATSLVAYGTSAGLLDQNASTAGQTASHSVPLTGLSPTTTYYYRVTSVDGSSNSTTFPATIDPPLSFTTTAGDCFADRVVADFTAGTPDANTAVSAAGDGAVTLRVALDESFGGTALPAGWSTYSWNAGSSATVAGGSLTVDGLRANPEPFTAGPGGSLEFVATLSGDALQHVGFGGGNHSTAPVVFNSYPWAMFSTGSSGGVMLARVVTAGGPEINTVIPGSWLGAPHTFRIDWDATEFRFWIDGVLRHTQATPIADPMRPAVSDYSTGGGGVAVDWMQLLAYPASGTFASRIFDAGVQSSWGAATWTATLPAGTSLAISTRRGNTATPDGAWTAFTPVPSSGSVVGGLSRYIQYSATLATTNPQVTPALEELGIACTVTPPDVTPPVITSVAASPGVDVTTATVTWTTDEAATSRVDYGTSPGSLTLNAESPALTLSHSVPLAGLAPGTTYYYRVTSQDAATNSATSPEPPATLTFATPAAPCPSDATAANFALGTLDANTAVSSTVGDGAVVLRRTVDEEFSGTALPSGWLSASWQGGGSLVVGGGQITVDGWRADPPQDFSAGATMEFVATFQAAQYQHVGFYTGGGLFTTYILFGTSGTTSTIFARATGTPTESITIGGAELIGTPHLYRIEWKASSVDYYVDGVYKATQPLAHGGPLKASISDFNPGGPALSVDRLSITPYLSPGTFLSRVFDQGGPTSWGVLSYTASTPAGTSVSTSVRIGNTPTPDGSWTAFVPVANGGTVGGGSRYVQYSAVLTSSDPAATPALQDITIACTPGGDVTPPMISAIVATPLAGGTTADITWNTDEPASSRVDYGTSPGDLSLNSSSATLVSSHSLGLMSLMPSTTYYYRVTSVDISGNTATSPTPPATLSFVTEALPPSVCAQDQTATDFAAGSLTNTMVTQVADGEVTLATTLHEEFDGTSLPPGWQAVAWGGGSTPTVNGGVLTMNGGHAATTATFSSGSSLEFVATFRGEVNQHIGLTADFNFNSPWAIFSTRSSTSALYARVTSPGGTTETQIGGPELIGSAHLYRIDWKAASFEFYVDGALVTTIPRTISSNMLVHGSDLSLGATALTLDWIRATPYLTPGTFVSRVHDGGAVVSWGAFNWTATTPVGTSLVMSARTGNAPVPDGTWTPFASVATPGSIVGRISRYVQYRVDLSTADPAVTPALEDIAIECSAPVVGDTITLTPQSPCLSTTSGCNTVAVGIDRTDLTDVRSFAVTFQVSAELALCTATLNDDIREGTYLNSVGTTSFQRTDNGGGSYTIEGEILGVPCGATAAAGTLFEVDLTHAVGNGTGTVTLTAVELRDCGSLTLGVAAGPPASLPIDTAAPGAIADLLSAQVTDGTPAGAGPGTTAIQLGWTAGEPGSTVEIYRKSFGNYPEYDDAPGAGSEPTVPASPALAVSEGWTLAGSTTSASLDDAPATRDAWYYVAFVLDACGNPSPPSNRSQGVLNYHLGDVSDGTTPGDGDNQVDGADVSALGAAYATAHGHPNYRNFLDIGPTANLSPTSRPTTDNLIEFEDLILFAINFGGVAKPSPAVTQEDGASRLALHVPAELPAVGGVFDVAMELDVKGNLRGLSVPLAWNGAVAEPIGYEPGSLAREQGGQILVFSPEPGTVDVAALGAGLRGAGPLAVVRFRVKALGEAGIRLGEVRARDEWNRPVELSGRVVAGEPAGTKLPAQTQLLPSAPNPFHRQAMLSFALAKPGRVSLRIYNISGRLVRTMADGAMEPGSYNLAWDGRDEGGSPVPSGVYFVRFIAPEVSANQRIVRTR